VTEGIGESRFRMCGEGEWNGIQEVEVGVVVSGGREKSFCQIIR
jgi:hypothetical protein